jgi:hypothetical protein
MDSANLSSPEAPRKPRRRWRHRLILGFLVIAVLVSAWVLWNYFAASSELESAIAEIEATDPGWRLADIETKRKVVPDASNSFLHILAIKALGTPAGLVPVGLVREESKLGKIDPQIRLDEVQIAALAKQLAASRKLVIEVHKLKDMPDGNSPTDSTDGMFVIGVARALNADAYERVQSGDVTGALESCLAIQHAARSFGDSPSLMHLLCRTACASISTRALERVIAQSELSEASEPLLKMIQEAMAKELSEASYLNAMRAERAFQHQMFEDFMAGKITSKDLFYGVVGISPTVDLWIIDNVPGVLTRQRAALLRSYTELIDALRSTPPEQDEKIESLRTKAEKAPASVRGPIPYLLGQRENLKRHQTNILCGYVAVAAERYRIAQNQWPESVESLVHAGYLKDAPTDPYDGKPLRFKRTDDGLIIYSIGPDKVDDGGDVAVIPPRSTSNDVGFRLWDVNKRGQAPPLSTPKASRERKRPEELDTSERLTPVAYAPGSPTVLKAEPAPDWDAKFQGKTFWIGGDGVASADLGGGRILWLLDDTLLGNVKDGGRAGATMVNNTLGIQENKDAAIRFLAGKKADGKPAAFILPNGGKGWFWPLSARRLGDRLIIFLAHIDKTPNPGVFGFKGIGVTLAVVDNPDAEPEKWHMKQHEVPFGDFTKGRERSWGSSLLPVGKDLYIYAYAEARGKGPLKRNLTVARAPAEKLDDFSTWRFYTGTGWSDKASESAKLADGMGTEFSVTPVPGGDGFVMVTTENGLSDRIMGRFAAAPEGPWSAPVLLYKCPEMGKDKGVFSYAAKAHSWAAKENELLISYCHNTWDFARLFRDEAVYRPKFVRVRLGSREN